MWRNYVCLKWVYQTKANYFKSYKYFNSTQICFQLYMNYAYMFQYLISRINYVDHVSVIVNDCIYTSGIFIYSVWETHVFHVSQLQYCLSQFGSHWIIVKCHSQQYLERVYMIHIFGGHHITHAFFSRHTDVSSACIQVTFLFLCNSLNKKCRNTRTGCTLRLSMT